MKTSNRWRAAARQRTLEQWELRAAEQHRLVDSMRYLHFPDGANTSHEPFLMHSSNWFAQMAPPRVQETLRRWKNDPDRCGALVIDGFGVDPELPPTPIDGRRSPRKLTTYSEQVACAIAAMLGEPISFATERGGTLVTDLSPVKGKEKALTNEGSEAYLGWHTEHAATGLLLSRPERVVDTLVFFHLRGDPQGEAKTLGADIRDALPLLAPDVLETLRRPEFVFRPPLLVRSSLPPDRREFRDLPVLTGDDEHPFANAALYGDMTEGQTTESRDALIELGKALDAVQVHLPTIPGRVVIVDNRRFFHARFPYKPAYDGNDRWLQRVMTTTSLEPFRAWQRHPSRRVLSPGNAG